ncbi:DUF58 domain-containing protein [Virgibacillus sp. LDC-1]|uniref:DUF58 domain-containing protein n=1 Tax=Virgibacillus sp. LDC-1 TaxID=3039856 RepID=UPI0024DEAAFA|nr:DUF58 domain-containing protein [Virgibacillus sp. LDC-1]
MKDHFRFVGSLVLHIVLIIALFSFAMFQGGFTSWFLFYSFLPISIYHLALLFYPIKRWRVERKQLQHMVRAGGHVPIHVQISRKLPFPLFYCVCEELLPPTLNKLDTRKEKYVYLHQPQKLQVRRRIKKMIFPWFRRQIRLSYELQHIPRGVHQLQAIRISIGDVFGFVKKEHVFLLEDELIAFPNERPLQLAEKLTSFQQGTASSLAFNLKNTNVASGIREYIPGDRFSWIDWKQTAKKNVVMTKEFEQEKSEDTLIVLDGCYHERFNALAFEAAIELTISLIGAIQQKSSQVGLLSITSETVFFPVQHDPTKREGIQQHLTRIEANGERHFAEQLKQELVRIPGTNSLVIVTTNLDHALSSFLQKIKQRKRKVHVFFIDAEVNIRDEQYNAVQQLQLQDIHIHILTEKELLQSPIEVNTW